MAPAEQRYKLKVPAKEGWMALGTNADLHWWLDNRGHSGLSCKSLPMPLPHPWKAFSC